VDIFEEIFQAWPVDRRSLRVSNSANASAA